MLKKVKNPILFQGTLQQNDYFEGWYYKQVSQDENHAISFIPGVSLIPEDQHSFVQYIWVQSESCGQTSTQTGYIRYPLEQFQYQDAPFAVKVGDNLFTENSMTIRLADDKVLIDGTLGIGPLYPIAHSLIQPNIMGIFGYLPKMQCYHGIISMMHSLTGILTVNGHKINFSGGKGYIEKDWGTSFPKEYIWIHSNHFHKPTTSLFFSVAHIPFHFTTFEGFICNMVVDGEEYRFATYNGSRCKVKRNGNQSITIYLQKDRIELTIEATILQQGELVAPVKGIMAKTIKEGISGIVRVSLIDRRSGKIYEDTGRHAGVEIVTDSMHLL